MRLCGRISSLFIGVSVGYAPATAGAHDHPLKVVPELVSQRYCFGDAEVFSVLLKLHVKYTNRTDKTLILDKGVGKAWYQVTVARSAEDLAAGKYESNPNIDWIFGEKDQFPQKPPLAGPGPDFAILKPGETYEGEIETSVVAQYEGTKDISGAIRSGTHVLQMQLSAWNRPGLRSEFEKSWREKGYLVTGVIKTEPIEIRVPAAPKIENECK